MNNSIDIVWSLVDEFTKKPKYVRISEGCIDTLANSWKETPLIDNGVFGPPSIPLPQDAIEKMERIIWYDLIASSVNYQYWYGKSNVRPNDAGATKMETLLAEAFNSYGSTQIVSIEHVISIFSARMAEERFPAISDRIRHLEELIRKDSTLTRGFDFVSYFAMAVEENAVDINNSLRMMITNFPGFAEDQFLKRAFLFFHILHRRMGWFKEEIKKVPIPADYQIPKMLRWLGCIEYENELKNLLYDNKFIPNGSLIECEIRASSILACRMLSDKSGYNMGAIDQYLWSRRKECTDSFHLTVTTDY